MTKLGLPFGIAIMFIMLITGFTYHVQNPDAPNGSPSKVDPIV